MFLISVAWKENLENVIGTNLRQFSLEVETFGIYLESPSLSCLWNV